jgi:hypothetical protein
VKFHDIFREFNWEENNKEIDPELEEKWPER